MSGKRSLNLVCSIYDACSALHTPTFVMIAVRWKGHWVFVRRKGLQTYDLPGGRVRTGESPENAARRILYEQTGVAAGKLYPICYYSLALSQPFNSRRTRRESYGQLYYAEALCKTALPESETEENRGDGWIPEENKWTYPDFQISLFRKACSWLNTVRQHGAPEQDAYFFEKVCGLIPCCRKNGIRHYLIIKNRSGHMGFPKGHTENGETEFETASREVQEEAGLSLTPLPDFRYCFSYQAQEHALRIHKSAVYFVAEFSEDRIPEIQIQPEEILGWWLLPYEEIMTMLNKQNDRSMLTRAEQFLARHHAS